MRNYEFTVILSPQRSESEINDFFQGFIAQVQDMGGILEKQAVSDLVRLGVPVAGNEQGVLGVASFALDPEKLPGAQRILADSESVLRSFVLHKKARKNRTSSRGLSFTAKPEAAREAKEETAMNPQAVDQKLEEMFKEEA
ncbi:MAG: 30S ribosomal protein S6 [bacterium]|nr:30S ribosomal protein S6 [bacterium]MDZ4231724.1 30S ribosomal protein S6 [Candidatus Pacearchaeota archaeon]